MTQIGTLMCTCGHFAVDHFPRLPLGNCWRCNCCKFDYERVRLRTFWGAVWAWLGASL
jgi:hypothetical protein